MEQQIACNPSRCIACNSKLIPRQNPRGGRFLGCAAFASTGCKASWSPEQGRWFGLGKQGECPSRRELAIRNLIALKGFDRNEAIEYLDAFGLLEIESMIAA